MQHAPLSASSAHRWMNCSGSPREIAKLAPEDQDNSSVYSREGNAAHALAERCLNLGRWAATFLGGRACSDGRILEPGQSIAISIDEMDNWFDIDEEMVAAVTLYQQTIAAQLARLGPGAKLIVERRVYPLPDRTHDMWGTADAIVYVPFGELVIIDFKYGKGVVVEADWNVQLIIYALGALQEIGAFDVISARIMIVQPRPWYDDYEEGAVRTFDVSPTELLGYSEGFREAAKRTDDPNAPLVAGEWCRWCPVAATCKAMRALVEAEAINDFAVLDVAPTARVPAEDDIPGLERAMQFLPALKVFFAEVPRRLQAALERGGKSQKFKVVRQRSNRRWKDPAEVERKLRNKAGVLVSDIYSTKLRSPKQLEEVEAIGRDWVAKYAEKPDGASTLVSVSDPRPVAIPACVSDFKPIIEDI